MTSKRAPGPSAMVPPRRLEGFARLTMARANQRRDPVESDHHKPRIGSVHDARPAREDGGSVSSTGTARALTVTSDPILPASWAVSKSAIWPLPSSFQR